MALKMPTEVSGCYLIVPSNPTLDVVTSPGVTWMLVILGLCIWMLFDPDIRKVGKAFLVITASWVALPATDWFMRLESQRFPLKYDYFLYRIDQCLGLTSFALARSLTGWQQTALLGV